MSYLLMGLASKDPNFQARCRGAVITIGRDIINAVEDSNSITTNAGVKLTTLSCKNLAKNFCKKTHLFTDEVLAMLMLMNYDVALNPSSENDGPVQYQTKEIWLTLVEIG